MIAAIVLGTVALVVIVALVLAVRRGGNKRIGTALEQFDTDLRLQEIVDRARNNPRIAELRGRHRQRTNPTE